MQIESYLQFICANYPFKDEPSQAKVLIEDGDAWKANRRPAVCLHLTASLGSVTDTLTLTGGRTYANDFEVRLKALTELTKTNA